MASSSEETLPQLPEDRHADQAKKFFRDCLVEAMLNLDGCEDGPSDRVEGTTGWKMIAHGRITRAQCEQAATRIIDRITLLHTQGPSVAEDNKWTEKFGHADDKTLNAENRLMVLCSILHHYKKMVLVMCTEVDPDSRVDLLIRRHVSQPKATYKDFRRTEQERKNTRYGKGALPKEQKWEPQHQLTDVLGPKKRRRKSLKSDPGSKGQPSDVVAAD